MSVPSSKQERLLEILQQSFAAQPVPDEPHVADDHALLVRWSDGGLSDSDRDHLLDHLARCPECREVLQTLLECGVLQHPEAEPAGADQDDPGAGHDTATVDAGWSPGRVTPTNHQMPRDRSPSRSSRVLRMAFGVVAAMVLIAVFLSLDSERPFDERVARLENQLSNDPQATLDAAVNLLPEADTSDERRRLTSLIESSGFEGGRQMLSQRRFDEVESLAVRLTALGIESGRLLNLVLQADQQVQEPLLLAMNDRLDRDFGYELTGRTLIKSPVSLTPKELSLDEQQRLHQFAEAVQKFPRQIELRLNYGMLLLKAGRKDDAQAQFEAARDIQPESSSAHLGLGLVLFERRKFQEALDEFQLAARLEPLRDDVTLNLAITLERLDRKADARSVWIELQNSTSDTLLRDRIQTHLNRTAP
jgi:tetratricopeptide (TPR) repeat protein